MRLEHLDDAAKRAYILADNKLAEKPGWDPEILKIELQHLTSLNLEFDVTITGFEMAEIDVLLGDAEPDADPADDVPEVEQGPAVTQLGDIWQIGGHRLICGDSTDAATYAHLLDGNAAQMVFTAAATPAYAELKNLCVWAKTNGGMGSLCRSQHELVFVFKNGSAPHINNVELGKHGRYRTNV